LAKNLPEGRTSNTLAKKYEILQHSVLIISGFIETFDTSHFVASAHVLVKFENILEMGDFF
jgi:hypothetical protein